MKVNWYLVTDMETLNALNYIIELVTLNDGSMLLSYMCSFITSSLPKRKKKNGSPYEQNLKTLNHILGIVTLNGSYYEQNLKTLNHILGIVTLNGSYNQFQLHTHY